MVTEDTGDLILTETGLVILSEDGFSAAATFRPRVDMSFSKNGNQSFSNIVGVSVNSEGNYRNRIQWHRLGRANEISFRLQFWGYQRFVCGPGTLSISA